MIGEKVNRLKVMAEAGSKKGNRVYLCLCECGTERHTRGSERSISGCCSSH
jgi:hypothetical protein